MNEDHFILSKFLATSMASPIHLDDSTNPALDCVVLMAILISCLAFTKKNRSVAKIVTFTKSYKLRKIRNSMLCNITIGIG